MIRVVLHIGQETGSPSATQNAVQAARNAAEAQANAAKAQANADRAIANAIRAAGYTSEGAEQAPAAEQPQAVGGKNGVIIIPTDGPDPDISVRVDGEGIHVTQGESQTLIPIRDVVPRGAVQIAWAIPATLSILVIWWPLSRAVIRWINRKNVSNTEAAALEARMRDRFETLERNLDTVAVEMERLSEGQRFTNKLLAERAEQERVPLSGQG